MKKQLQITKTLILAVALTVSARSALAGERVSNHSSLSKSAQGILLHIERGELRPAICAAADYELDLLGRYKLPSFEAGLFQDEATHLSFHSPFDTWKRADAEELGLPKELPMTGISFLLGLEGASEEERLLVMSFNIRQIERRMGNASDGMSLSSDRGLQLIAQSIAGQFGVVKSHRYRAIGDHRVLDLELAAAFFGPDMRMIMLPRDGVVFLFLLCSPAGDSIPNQERLEELIMTASFDFKSANAAAVAAARAKSRRSDPESVVACVESLVALGEYTAAAEELSDLRVLLHSRLPGARIRNQVASLPAYGITLKNPDSTKWKLTALNQAPLTGVFLEDRYSVNEEGIMVCVIDLLVVYGPQLVKLLNDDESAKSTLIDAGRGGSMTIGTIESERLTTINGSMAYEAVVAPNLASVKARIQWVNRTDYGLMVLVIGNANQFDAKLAECDRILQEHLKFAESPVKPGNLAATQR